LTVKGWLLSFSPLFIFLIGIIAGRFINGQWLSIAGFYQNNDLLNMTNFGMWFFPLLTYGFGEEAGWRGYALPQLQSKHSAMMATIILTMFWLGWHIPTFFYRYQLSGGMLVGFISGLFAGAICLTFLFNYTRGSLLAVSCWHFTFNFVSMIGTEQVVAATMSTIIMLLAVFIVIKYRMKDLSPFPKTAIEFGHLIIKVQ
jgi:membrane protease YdiL (CAAX protease family)